MAKNLHKYGNMFSKTIALIAGLLILTTKASGITPELQQLVHFETQANSASHKPADQIMLPHISIPTEVLEANFAERIDPALKDSLIFEDHGKTYVRWILNPDDTKWGKVLVSFLQSKGLSTKVEYYYKAFPTASRSYIAEDPITGATFSVKSSTNTTGGQWKDKKQPLGEAIDARIFSDYLYNLNAQSPFHYFDFMDEPAIFGLEEIDQAVVIRNLNPVNAKKSEHYYLPGFSALHEVTGKEIALKNGSEDPAAFWTEHYVKAAGRALGELAVRTGFQPDSPHSQNFLIELDKNYRPTGKIILRDMADFRVEKHFLKDFGRGALEVLEKIDQRGNIVGSLPAQFMPTHGMDLPKWLSEKEKPSLRNFFQGRAHPLLDSWKKTFFDAFEKSFQEFGNVDISKLNTTYRDRSGGFAANYLVSLDPQFESLFEKMRAQGYIENPHVRMCRRTLVK